MSEIGQLTMTFSKPLTVPELFKNLPQKLKEADWTDEADQLIRLSVQSDQFEESSSQIEISDFYFARFEGNQVDLKIEFAYPDRISVSWTNQESL